MLKIKDRLKHNIQPSCLGSFDVRAEKRSEKYLIKIIIASGPEKPYFKRKYGMTEKGCFIRVGTATEPLPQKMIEELFAKRTRNSLGRIISRKQDLRFEQLRIFFEEAGFCLNENFATDLELLAESAVAEEIIRIPGIIGAVTRTDLIKGSLVPTPVSMKILNNFHLKRFGHVHVIADQFWYFYYEMETTTHIAAIHCSPWTYDTYVPLFFAGYGMPSQQIVRPVTPYDIAATIANLLKIKPPAGSVGIPLVEVLK